MMDLLDMLDRLNEPPLLAPAHYTDEVYPVTEFERTFRAWADEHGTFGSAYRYPGWRDGLSFDEAGITLDGHEVAAIRAWLGNPDPSIRDTHARWAHRALCEPCGWASAVVDDRELRVALWLDHAAPGWRDLEPVPPQPQPGRATGGRTRHERWIEIVEGVYPRRWARPGAPVVTIRQEFATRTVGGRSPWGGYDVSDRTQRLVLQELDLEPTPPGPQLATGQAGRPGLVRPGLRPRRARGRIEEWVK